MSATAKAKAESKKGTKGGARGAHDTRDDREAYSSQWPLTVLRVEAGFQERGVAYVQVGRHARSGYVVAGFLVDLMGLGLKDSYGHSCLSERGYTGLILGSEADWEELTLELAQDLVYGGLAWARRWKFRVPRLATKHLGILPKPEGEPSLARFGGVGRSGDRPLVVGDIDDLARAMFPEDDADDA